MKKLGLVIKDLGASELIYHIIRNTNKFLNDNYKTDIMVFFENFVSSSFVPKFSCMQANELWGYNGPVITTNLNAAENILNIPTIPKKFFYIWDLEWLTHPEKNYLRFLQTYSNPKLNLICRAGHKDIIENCWNRQVAATIEDFDINKILEICYE